MPKVSVIIPVYGVEKYIERCARSLFEQTLDDIEFIFVDDCTLDRSMEILGQIIEEYRLRFAEKNYVVRTERMPTNSGQAAVRRHGIQLCTGNYIIHCDSDDWVDKEMYKKMYESAVLNKADMVVCDYYVTDGCQNNTVVNSCHSTSITTFIENCLLQRDSWSLCNKLFKKSAYYKVVFPNGAMGEDMATTMQLLWNCNSLSYVKEPLYYYYYNVNSISKKVSAESCLKRFNQIKENTDLVLNLFQDKHLTPAMKDGLINIQYLAKRALLPIVWKRDYYKLWIYTYKGLIFKLILSKNISTKDKVGYALTLLHLYPREKNRAKT